MSEAQSSRPADPAAPGEDPRIGLIEKERSVPLTEAQRKQLVRAMKDVDKEWAPARRFAIPDGTEPDFVFRPTAGQTEEGSTKR